MVVSNQRVTTSVRPFEDLRHAPAMRDRWLPSIIRTVVAWARNLRPVHAAIGYNPEPMVWSAPDGYADLRYCASLLERSPLMFRRENQGESFDDDVAALRDRAGSGRREQSESSPEPDDDQTTYSPPRQTWSPIQPSQDSDIGATTPAPVERAPVAAGDASVIAADTRWDGTVQSQGALHIHGNVSGQIHTEGDVFVAEGASVSAEVRANGVTVAGVLEGNVECTGRFEVLPSGKVSANVAAPRLVVHEGARVIGKLRMTSEGEVSG